MKKGSDNLITKNKKAYFDYEILDTWEAGLELRGYEVKSVRGGNVHLKGAYIVFIGGQLYIKGMHIGLWRTLAHRGTIDTDSERKVFLHKKTLVFLYSKSKQPGSAIIPLELYFKGSLIKLRVGLVKGRKAYQKKQILKERTMDREAKIMMNRFL